MKYDPSAVTLESEKYPIFNEDTFTCKIKDNTPGNLVEDMLFSCFQGCKEVVALQFRLFIHCGTQMVEA